MIKHCMDCGAKLDRLHDSKNILKYECKTCMAIWVRTVKIIDSWDKQESSHMEIKANGFRITAPDVAAPLKIKESSKNLIESLPKLPADEHLTMQQAINEAAKINGVREEYRLIGIDLANEKINAREKEILQKELFGDDDK